MKTIKEVTDAYRRELSLVYEANEAEAITLLVVGELTGLSNAKIKAFPETAVSEQATDRFNEVLADLLTGKPVQYVLGTTEFYGLKFTVNPSVLIPRPETEELVEWILKSVDAAHAAQYQILDIGTGSGCIAISLKSKLREAKIGAIDISHAALLTAATNADLNKAEIEFIEADILNITPADASRILDPGSRLSLIVSNPPYVTLSDKIQMHTNVTDFEPHTALFVPEDDPLVFYKAITVFAVQHLAAAGLLFFEINESYGHEVASLLENKGFVNIEIRKDMAGRDRMIKASLK